MDANDHILIVDDDPGIRELLAEYLQKNGYRTSEAADGQQMRRLLQQQRIDLLVLDLMLPGEDGLSLCRNLRVDSDLPVIMLTARGEDMDRIIGLEMGADDYMAKPFNPRELLARIKVVLRRARALPRNDPAEDSGRLRFAGWTVDTEQRELFDRDGQRVPLSRGEYRLLKVFLDHPNHALSRDQLMELTQGKDHYPFDRSIDVQVSRLRRRLGDDPRQPQLIKTLRGHGYVFAGRLERD